jgi:hypothetical protein
MVKRLKTLGKFIQKLEVLRMILELLRESLNTSLEVIFLYFRFFGWFRQEHILILCTDLYLGHLLDIFDHLQGITDNLKGKTPQTEGIELLPITNDGKRHSGGSGEDIHMIKVDHVVVVLSKKSHSLKNTVQSSFSVCRRQDQSGLGLLAELLHTHLLVVIADLTSLTDSEDIVIESDRDAMVSDLSFPTLDEFIEEKERGTDTLVVRDEVIFIILADIPTTDADSNTVVDLFHIGERMGDGVLVGPYYGLDLSEDLVSQGTESLTVHHFSKSPSPDSTYEFPFFEFEKARGFGCCGPSMSVSRSPIEDRLAASSEGPFDWLFANKTDHFLQALADTGVVLESAGLLDKRVNEDMTLTVPLKGSEVSLH